MLTKGPGDEEAEQEAFEQNDREHVLRAAPYGARRLGFEITLNDPGHAQAVVVGGAAPAQGTNCDPRAPGHAPAADQRSITVPGGLSMAASTTSGVRVGAKVWMKSST